MKNTFSTVCSIFDKGYRYGFNGKELDKNIEGMGGGGSTYDYGFRIYNPNLCRFLSIDPLRNDFPELSTYQFSSNMPIVAIDLDGLEAVIVINSQYYMKKIKHAMTFGDIEEAERLVWEAVSKGSNSAKFNSDEKKVGGFVIYFKKKNIDNILFSQASSDVFTSPKRSWPKGGYDWSMLTTIDKTISNNKSKINSIDNKIKKLNDEIDKIKLDFEEQKRSFDEASTGDGSKGLIWWSIIESALINEKIENLNKVIKNLNSDKEIIEEENKTLVNKKKEIIDTNTKIEKNNG